MHVIIGKKLSLLVKYYVAKNQKIPIFSFKDMLVPFNMKLCPKLLNCIMKTQSILVKF